MRAPRLVLLSILIVLTAILLLSSIYVVEVKDFALVTQFGRVVATLGGLIMHYRPTMDIQRIMLPALMSALAANEPGLSA